jgi:hypothetical protein
VRGVVAVPAVASLLSLAVALFSDAFLVEFDHLGALIFVPEGSELGRNGGSASATVEAVAVGTLVGVVAMVVVVIGASSYSVVAVEDAIAGVAPVAASEVVPGVVSEVVASFSVLGVGLVATGRVDVPFVSFSGSAVTFPGHSVPGIAVALVSVDGVADGVGLNSRVVGLFGAESVVDFRGVGIFPISVSVSVFLEVIGFLDFFAGASSASGDVVTFELGVDHAVVLGICGSAVDGDEDGFLLCGVLLIGVVAHHLIARLVFTLVVSVKVATVAPVRVIGVGSSGSLFVSVTVVLVGVGHIGTGAIPGSAGVITIASVPVPVPVFSVFRPLRANLVSSALGIVFGLSALNLPLAPSEISHLFVSIGRFVLILANLFFGDHGPDCFQLHLLFDIEFVSVVVSVVEGAGRQVGIDIELVSVALVSVLVESGVAASASAQPFVVAEIVVGFGDAYPLAFTLILRDFVGEEGAEGDVGGFAVGFQIDGRRKLQSLHTVALCPGN